MARWNEAESNEITPVGAVNVRSQSTRTSTAWKRAENPLPLTERSLRNTTASRPSVDNNGGGLAVPQNLQKQDEVGTNTEIPLLSEKFAVVLFVHEPLEDAHTVKAAVLAVGDVFHIEHVEDQTNTFLLNQTHVT